ncbi:hypothetical protein ACEWY4_021701 [Coilia grayii]|uniref:C3H1-type domain-containing protein n=1 Tax=Coilia grayii TaxID=363190 RepID=A0ABD1J3X5_9TELE
MQTSMDRQQSKVERFLKLGYSHADIVRVLDSLRHDAQTNDILEELIKTCHKTSATSTGTGTSSGTGQPAYHGTTTSRHTAGTNGLPGGTGKTPRASSSSPQLVARGCSSPRAVSPSQSPMPADRNHASNFRPVVIDGSNVAMSHGNKQVFSCRGVQLAVKWFWDRGMRDITVFVPLWRKEQPRPETPITDQPILTELERKKILVFTPSRCVNGKRIVCYDDRYIVKMAYDSDGIIVSNDNYRDLQIEKPQWKKFIEERLLMYTFANDTFMPPEDPLGRNGPTLDNFLRKTPTVPENKQQPCPYGKKCTYGVKCKYYHPERADQSQLSVADELRAKSKSAIEQNQALQHQTSTAATPAIHRYTQALSDMGLPGYSHVGYPPGMLPSVVGQEDRSSPGLRSSRSSSPRISGHPNGSLLTSGDPESDPGFGSLELPLPWIQDLPLHQQQLEVPLHPRSMAPSSGVAGLSMGSDFCLSDGSRPDIGEYLDHAHDTGMGLQRPGCCYPPLMQEARGTGSHPYPGAPMGHGQCLYEPPHPHMHVPPPAHGHGGRFHSYDHPEHRSSVEAHRQQSYRGHRSLERPMDYWMSQAQADMAANRGGGCPSSSLSEKRQVVKAQLNNIFPPNCVDQVMSLYPNVYETNELLALIKKFKTSF